MKPPRHPIEFKLEIGAETMQHLVDQLTRIAQEADRGELSTISAWGGAGTAGNYMLNVDRSITVESYRRNLAAWVERSKNDQPTNRDPGDEA